MDARVVPWDQALSAVCPGDYAMVLLTPPVGGQRQAYTQVNPRRRVPPIS